MDTCKQGIGRRWTIEEKQRIVLETLEPNASVPRVAQQYALNPNLVFKWRKEYREGRLKNGTGTSRLLPVKISDEQLVEAANLQPVASRAPVGTMEIQLPKAQLRITGRVDLLTLRMAIACLQ